MPRSAGQQEMPLIRQDLPAHEEGPRTPKPAATGELGFVSMQDQRWYKGAVVDVIAMKGGTCFLFYRPLPMAAATGKEGLVSTQALLIQRVRILRRM